MRIGLSTLPYAALRYLPGLLSVTVSLINNIVRRDALNRE